MKVRVVFPGYFAGKAGESEAEIALSRGTVGELIEVLRARYPHVARELMEEDRLSPSYFLAVNNEMISVPPEDLLGHALNDGDEVSFVFAIAGGL